MSKLLFAAIFVLGLGSLLPEQSLAQQHTFDWVQSDIDVYNLRVVRVSGRRLTVHVSELDGRRTFNVPRDYKFYIDGEPTDVTKLRPNQRLTAYVTRAENRKVVLVDAGAQQATPPAKPPAPPVIAVQAPAPAPAMLPKTGSPLPLIGLGGVIMLVTAFGMRTNRASK